VKSARYTIAFNMGKRRRQIVIDAFSFSDAQVKVKKSYGMGCDRFKLIHKEI
jgi:hypothetical protein